MTTASAKGFESSEGALHAEVRGDAIDVSMLPSFAFSHRGPMWWATMGMLVIEGTVFALLLVSYFYLRSLSSSWPMSALPPDLFWGTLNTLILLVSAIPNHLAKKAAVKQDLRGSRLELRTPEQPAVAIADPDRVRQIIRILLDNALTHTPEGTKVTVTTYSANRRAELTVSDEGSGIPQRVQSRIFERFYTADTAGGSGLGLAIARELTQRMDGRITISSSRRYTAFTVDLPPAGREEAPATQPAPLGLRAAS